MPQRNPYRYESKKSGNVTQEPSYYSVRHLLDCLFRIRFERLRDVFLTLIVQ